MRSVLSHLCFSYLVMMLMIIFCNLHGAHSAAGKCSSKDISISQSEISATGIPRHRVQIVNTCTSECAPSDIHVSCVWFASANTVNPTIFKRLAFDDCLVNGGEPLKPHQTISFTYSNTFKYPLAFKSAKFC